MVLRVLRRFPSVTATGVELSPAVWFLGFLRTRRYRVRFLLGSLFSQNIFDADVVFLYMLPHMMEKIEAKLDAELRPGAVVISHAVPFPHRVPAEEVLVPHGRRSVPLLRYVW